MCRTGSSAHPRARPDPANHPTGQDAPAVTGFAQTQDPPEGQPSLWPSRAKGRQVGAPAPATNTRRHLAAMAVPSCPTQTRNREGRRDLGQSEEQWDAHRSCGVIPKARMVGHAQSFQTQLSLPTLAPRSRERIGTGTDMSMRSSENDSVLLCPVPPQAAVQGAQAAVLLLLLLSKLHKHLFQCCLRKAAHFQFHSTFP